MTAAAAETVHTRFRPSPGGWIARVAVLVAVFGGLIWITAIVPQYWAFRISLAAVYAIIGLSLNIVLGYTGQVSLGHHAFVGLAAFISAAVVTEKGQTFWIGLMAGVLSGAISAGLLGLVALRIKGLYLALITLTYGFVAANSIFEMPALTRGGAGMPAPRPPQFETDREFAFLCLAFVALALFIDWRIVRSKVGRAILAVKHSEAVAASYAVNITFYKVFAFILSGALAGLAGSLFAHRTTTVVSNDFNFQIALLWVLMVVVGGLGRRTGVVIASAFFALFPFLIQLVTPLNNWLEHTVQRDPEELTTVVGALLALLTIILYPGGLAEQLSPITRWLSGQRFTMHPEGRKHHPKKGLATRLGLPGKSAAPAEEPIAEPATSPELLGEGESAPTEEIETVGGTRE